MTVLHKKTISNYGIGKNKICELLKSIGLNLRKHPKKFKLRQQAEIEKRVNKTVHGKKYKDNIKENIVFLSKIKSYKGVRHKLGYPVRGQRTHTNAKTKKFKF
jgi:small subunit ribosomal protein S13